MQLRCNADYYQGDSRNSAPLPDEIIEFSFIISWAGRHIRLKLFHRKNFDTDINYITDEEGHMFHKQIKRNKSILSELNFHRYPVFEEVRLIVREDGFLPGFRYRSFLFSRGHVHCAANEGRVMCDPI